jgi:tRNA (guanine37-N1)-methyltransferase
VIRQNLNENCTSAMKFSVLTLFPECLLSYFNTSILKRAQDGGYIEIEVIDIRKFSKDKHKAVDDIPYGGGPGMVMSAQPILDAWDTIRTDDSHTIIFSPGGLKFTNVVAKTIAKNEKHLILIAGRYEGVDARVQEITNGQNISIGDYVLTGGEIPSMVIVDCVSRQIPGVLGNTNSLEDDRLASSKVYTRPEVFSHAGVEYMVPEVLVNGDHRKIEEWRSKN